MIEEHLKEFEEKLKSNKELVEIAMDLLDKVKRFIRIAKAIDNIYVNKILADETWRKNTDLLMTEEEKQIAYYVFDMIHNLIQYLENQNMEG